MLIGSLLGDGHVEYNGPLCRVRFDHSIKQKEYVQWKHGVFSPLAGKLVERKVFDRRTEKTYEKVRFNTLTLGCFNPYGEIFYSGRKKIVPLNIPELLSSPLALAVWYLDDGALRKDCAAFRLHTNSYTLEEVELLQETLLVNFHLNSTIHRQGGGFLLHIGAKNCVTDWSRKVLPYDKTFCSLDNANHAL